MPLTVDATSSSISTFSFIAMVQDWTPCGEDRVCLGSRCVPKPQLQTKCTNCSTMTGTCTNQGTCFCHRGWTGHNCSTRYNETIHQNNSKSVSGFSVLALTMTFTMLLIFFKLMFSRGKNRKRKSIKVNLATLI